MTKEHKCLSLVITDYTKGKGSLSLRKSFSIILNRIINFLFPVTSLCERKFDFIRTGIRVVKSILSHERINYALKNGFVFPK